MDDSKKDKKKGKIKRTKEEKIKSIKPTSIQDESDRQTRVSEILVGVDTS